MKIAKIEDSIHLNLKLLATKKQTTIQEELNRILKEWIDKHGKEIPK